MVATNPNLVFMGGFAPSGHVFSQLIGLRLLEAPA